MIAERAPAKINLYLHVGPARRDGLHEIRSLFVFLDDGDRVDVSAAEDVSLEIAGPFASELSDHPLTDNLVMKAARALRSAAGVSAGAAIRLDKRLPVASGIGGGSTDAAAALRALIRLWRPKIGESALRRVAFGLGADVPACLDGRPVLVAGAGEILGAGPALPPLWATLVNPRRPMPTGPVFRAFDRTNPRPDQPSHPRAADVFSYAGAVRLLSLSRNDLQPIAVRMEPPIGEALNFLAECCGNLGARMSGSGATVFGLFASLGAAERAACKARGRGWWSMAAQVRTGRGYGGAPGGT
jgi:4-diphosphocytidyl-2-C-methyl-D-erythritol kinase